MNPVDLIASADAARYRAALRAVVKDPGVDGLLVLFVSPAMIDTAAVAEAIVDAVKNKGKTVMACVMGRQRSLEALEILRRCGIPAFRYPEDAATTMRLLVRRHQWLQRKPGKMRTFRVDQTRAREILERKPPRDGWLTGREAEAVLAAYGIPFVASRRVTKAGDAVVAAHDLGLPVVLKAEARGLIHKSEHRAVVTGLQTGDDVYRTARDMLTRLKRKFRSVSLQVQAHAQGHREVLLGMTRDPRYGPLFAVGLGGVQVEVLRDVSIRIGPLDDRDPAEMFAALKGAALLGPFRGDPPVDLDAAAEGLLRLQQLVRDFPTIHEVEINPFILASRGKSSAAVDARLRLEVR